MVVSSLELLLSILLNVRWSIPTCVSDSVDLLLATTLSTGKAPTRILLHGVAASTFHNCLFNINSTAVNLSDLMISDQIVGDMLLLESYETKSSTLASIDVLQNNRINNFSKLIKVVLQLFIRQLEI